ncbi:cell division protein SepF [Bacillus sp. BRMEA1]|uniref:cell division protein SepF n=1 Tax=Neobacillus endophyticus TaxID=2738405 RepID=UPI00156385BF|nr:cell division protein SepF [Neobacillus endophyticus]NRD78798.1 cell division protein SepF [Neobacillus endophyticus]
MTIKSKLKNFFFLDDDDSEDKEIQADAQEPMKPKKQPVKNQNVVSLQSVQKNSNIQKSSKVILVEPRTYSEATEIADQLKNRRAVVVNLQRIDPEQGRQIIDFLSGAVYVISGDIQKIGSGIFLCTPENVEVSGNISSLLSEHENPNMRW